jgi:uncharacterized protein (DUF934 family)
MAGGDVNLLQEKTGNEAGAGIDRGERREAKDLLLRRDQIPILRRAGFDALEITHPGTIQALRDGVVIAVQRHYQPASLEAVEGKPGWRPWLRVSPAS